MATTDLETGGPDRMEVALACAAVILLLAAIAFVVGAAVFS